MNGMVANISAADEGAGQHAKGENGLFHGTRAPLPPKLPVERDGVVILSNDFADLGVKSPIQAMSPWLLASCTACVRRLAPSLSNTRLVWVLIVFSLTNSRSAISLLLRPSAIS